MENKLSDHDKDQDLGYNEIIIKCDLENMAKTFFKDYEIIWHDPNVNSEENQQYMAQFEELCKVKTFTKWTGAKEYIKAAKTICHVITSGTNGELLVKEIFSRKNVPNIFTFCRNEEYHSAWSFNYEKILCTETKIEDVISQIQKNLLEWQRQTSSLKFDLPAFAPIFNDHDKSQMNHLHLYLKVIPRFKNWKQAKEDFLILSKKVFSDKKNENFIADFEQNYNEYNKEAILRWYTQQSFLYKVINNCLRIATSDSIQWSRFLLKDLEEAIKDQYNTKSKNFSGVLYRAAYLSEKEWLNLKNNVNREIEMHGFLSASKENHIAVKFMGIDPAQKVFITIIVLKGPIEEEQGFAEIEEFSKFPKEKEVLFNVRSRFTILEAEDEYSKDLPYRHLVLLYGAQGLRRFTAEENSMQKISLQDVKNILCSHCQILADKMTEKMIFVSLADLEKPIYSCQKCLVYDTAAPFLCVPIRKHTLTTEIQGCLLMNSSQIKTPFYGYKCSQCGAKKKERYFVCTNCCKSKMKWCESCFTHPLSCVQIGHSIILESFPFSFWCEKMLENELKHLMFQNNLTTDSNNKFQQAEMYNKTHEYEKAIEFYHAYIKQNEARNNKVELSIPYNNVGLIYWNQREYKKSLEFLLQSLSLSISAYGENSSFVAVSLNNVGLVYQDQGEYSKAFEFFRKSLNIRKSVYGESHSSVANSYNNIGSIYEAQGEYKKALEYHFKSLEIDRSIHGESHPKVATSYNNMGLVYYKQGDDKKALEYFLKSLEIRIVIYGENSPNVATSYTNMGLVCHKQGEDKKALEYIFKSLESNRSVHGENHPEVAISYFNIGSIYENLGEYEQSYQYYLKSLDIHNSVYGEDHPQTATLHDKIRKVTSILVKRFS